MTVRNTGNKVSLSTLQQIIHESKKGITLAIHAVPRAAKNEIVSIHANALRIRLKAAPVEGAANAALLAFIAEVLGIPQQQIELVSGYTSRHKIVAISGLTKDTIITKLQTYLHH